MPKAKEIKASSNGTTQLACRVETDFRDELQSYVDRYNQSRPVDRINMSSLVRKILQAGWDVVKKDMPPEAGR